MKWWNIFSLIIAIGITFVTATSILECPEEGRFPDLTTCGRFYDCISDNSGSYVITRNHCQGFEFNATSRTCSSTRCYLRRGRSVPVAQPTYSHLCGSDPNSFLCADCKSMVMCVKGQAFVQRCSKGAYCATRNAFGGAVCYPGRPRECTCEKPHEMRQDFYNPQRFFSCEDAGSSPVGYRCSDGMIFDEAIQQCRNKDSPLPCSLSGSFAIPGSCTEYYSCIRIKHGWLQKMFMCRNGSSFSEKSQRCEDPCSGNFECMKEGYLSDPFDARRFFTCLEVSGQMIKVHYQCPTGHIWNSNFTMGSEVCVEDTEDDSLSPCFVPSDACPDVNIFPESVKAMLITDSCDLEPCFPGVACTPEPEAPFYSCGACPPGREGDGLVCKCAVGRVGNDEECGPDSDLDGYPDFELGCSNPHCRRDNCVAVPNSGQEDTDGDQVGDACDGDADDDGFDNYTDNCPLIPNPLQEDADADGRGDLCDNCPYVPDPEQEDADEDLLGDDCDPDIDNDGILNEYDNCPFVANALQNDTDGDGVGDKCDNCPKDPNPWQENQDDDSAGDACDDDSDRDRDGVQDTADSCPDRANSDQADADGDGVGDACDVDSDDDGVDDSRDNCPLIPNPDQADFDADGRGDVCASDYDGDGIDDASDNCFRNPAVHTTDFRYLQTVALDHEHHIFLPEWLVYDHGSEIHQTRSTDPVLAVGDHNIGNVDYEGTLFVQDHSDDDYVGIVFSYQSNAKFYALTWKKETQLWKTLAKKGVQLKVINSATGPGEELRRALWYSDTTENQTTVLWQNETLGWQADVAYRWRLHHRPDFGVMRLYLYEGSNLVADSGNVYDKTLQGGRLGFYCFSQRAVVWSNVKYTCADNLPKAMLDDLHSS